MNLIFRAAINLFKVGYWKIRYGSRIEISWIQGFEHMKIEISGNGRVRVGSRLQNRGELRLICGDGASLEIGNHVVLNTGVCITSLGHVKIGDYCKLANHLILVDHDHNFRGQGEEFVIGEVTIGDRVWVGANCTILKNVHIGNDCVIAAGSVVSKDVPPGTLYRQKREIMYTPIEELCKNRQA